MGPGAMDPILHAFLLCLLTSLSAVSTLSTLPQTCLCEVMNSTATQDSHEDGLHLQVEVDGRSVMATTDTTYLCATLDWYPQDRCNYGSCSWDHASILYIVSFRSTLSQSCLPTTSFGSTDRLTFHVFGRVVLVLLQILQVAY